jgi:hypothetical protein
MGDVPRQVAEALEAARSDDLRNRGFANPNQSSDGVENGRVRGLASKLTASSARPRGARADGASTTADSDMPLNFSSLLSVRACNVPVLSSLSKRIRLEADTPAALASGVGFIRVCSRIRRRYSRC